MGFASPGWMFFDNWTLMFLWILRLHDPISCANAEPYTNIIPNCHPQG